MIFEWTVDFICSLISYWANIFANSISGFEFVSFAAFPDESFKANKPFFFALTNGQTKQVLFSGRIRAL